MKNSDMPATPVMDESDYGQHYGLTKLEYAMINLPDLDVEVKDIKAFEAVIGRKVNQEDPFDILEAAARCDAVYRKMRALAILELAGE